MRRRGSSKRKQSSKMCSNQQNQFWKPLTGRQTEMVELRLSRHAQLLFRTLCAFLPSICMYDCLSIWQLTHRVLLGALVSGITTLCTMILQYCSKILSCNCLLKISKILLQSCEHNVDNVDSPLFVLIETSQKTEKSWKERRWIIWSRVLHWMIKISTLLDK